MGSAISVTVKDPESGESIVYDSKTEFCKVNEIDKGTYKKHSAAGLNPWEILHRATRAITVTVVDPKSGEITDFLTLTDFCKKAKTISVQYWIYIARGMTPYEILHRNPLLSFEHAGWVYEYTVDSELANLFGIPTDTFKRRIKLGWTLLEVCELEPRSCMPGLIYGIALKASPEKILYVGQTVNDITVLNKRYHDEALKATRPISRFMSNNGGFNKFVITVIEEVMQKDRLDDRERFYINEYDLVENGLNCTKGGGNGGKYGNKRPVMFRGVRYGTQTELCRFLTKLTNYPVNNGTLIKWLNRDNLSDAEIIESIEKIKKQKEQLTFHGRCFNYNQEIADYLDVDLTTLYNWRKRRVIDIDNGKERPLTDAEMVDLSVKMVDARMFDGKRYNSAGDIYLFLEISMGKYYKLKNKNYTDKEIIKYAKDLNASR